MRPNEPNELETIMGYSPKPSTPRPTPGQQSQVTRGNARPGSMPRGPVGPSTR